MATGDLCTTDRSNSEHRRFDGFSNVIIDTFTNGSEPKGASERDNLGEAAQYQRHLLTIDTTDNLFRKYIVFEAGAVDDSFERPNNDEFGMEWREDQGRMYTTSRINNPRGSYAYDGFSPVLVDQATPGLFAYRGMCFEGNSGAVDMLMGRASALDRYNGYTTTVNATLVKAESNFGVWWEDEVGIEGHVLLELFAVNDHRITRYQGFTNTIDDQVVIPSVNVAPRGQTNLLSSRTGQGFVFEAVRNSWVWGDFARARIAQVFDASQADLEWEDTAEAATLQVFDAAQADLDWEDTADVALLQVFDASQADLEWEDSADVSVVETFTASRADLEWEDTATVTVLEPVIDACVDLETTVTNRVGLATTTTNRVGLAVSVCEESVMSKCPAELNWQSDAVIDVAATDDLNGGAQITSGTATLQIFDEDTDGQIGSDITLSAPEFDNVWRANVFVDGSNGFEQSQRLRLEWSFDGGNGVRGYSVTKAVVATA